MQAERTLPGKFSLTHSVCFVCYVCFGSLDKFPGSALLINDAGRLIRGLKALEEKAAAADMLKCVCCFARRGPRGATRDGVLIM